MGRIFDFIKKWAVIIFLTWLTILCIGNGIFLIIGFHFEGILLLIPPIGLIKGIIHVYKNWW